jgi:hypothetical protein
MSPLDGIAHLVSSSVLGAVLVGLAMLPAWLLVVAYRRGGARILWHVAILLSATLFWFLALPGVIAERNWGTILFAGFTTVMPPLTAAVAIASGIGAGRALQQTLGAGSVGILTAALPFMLFSVLKGPRSARVMAVAAVALTAYLAVRHWSLTRTHRSLAR